MPCCAVVVADALVNSAVTNHAAQTRTGLQQIQNQIKESESSLEKQQKEDAEKFRKLYDAHMQYVSARMCTWAAPHYTDMGSSTDRNLWLVAQIAIAAAQIYLQTYIQNKQYEIAKAYADITKDKWERFKNAYVPLERKLLAEAGNAAEYEPDYAAARSRGSSAAERAYSLAEQAFTTKAGQYALCIDPSVNLDANRARSRDDTINFSYRDEENYAYYKQDKRWNRRSDILNIGRGNISTAFSYAKSASQNYAGLSAALQQVGNGISGMFGYLGNRMEMTYPTTFAQTAVYGQGAIGAGAVPQVS